MGKFMGIEKLGMLEIETVLVEMNEPVFFICKNEKEDLFLCSCCQANKNGKKWLITKTSPDIIVKILKDEITLREAFYVFKDIQISVYAFDGDIKITEHEVVDWDYENSIFLPDKEEYMEAEEDEFLEEISYYEGKKIETYKDIKIEKVVKCSSLDVKTFQIDETEGTELFDYSFLINEQIFEKMKIFNRLLERKFKIGLKEQKKYEFDYDNNGMELNEIRMSLEYPDCVSRQGYMINVTGQCTIVDAA